MWFCLPLVAPKKSWSEPYPIEKPIAMVCQGLINDFDQLHQRADEVWVFLQVVLVVQSETNQPWCRVELGAVGKNLNWNFFLKERKEPVNYSAGLLLINLGIFGGSKHKTIGLEGRVNFEIIKYQTWVFAKIILNLELA